MFFQHFIECIFHFNNYEKHEKYNKFPQSERSVELSGRAGRVVGDGQLLCTSLEAQTPALALLVAGLPSLDRVMRDHSFVQWRPKEVPLRSIVISIMYLHRG